MARKGSGRLLRIRYLYLALVSTITVAIVLILKEGFGSAWISLSAIGAVSTTMLIGVLILETWLWKSRLGLALGFPPDYKSMGSESLESMGSESLKIAKESMRNQ